ncbi:MAG: ribbon-helix-helix protein, CopG family [Candidatus Binatia bacterium]
MSAKKRTKARSPEERLVAEHERHRGDVSGWRRVGATTGSRGTALISIRLAPREIDEVRKEASARGVTISDFVRQALADAIRQRNVVVHGTSEPSPSAALTPPLSVSGFSAPFEVSVSLTSG